MVQRIGRRALGAGVGSLLASGAWAQGKRLDVLGHRVMQSVLTGGAAGDQTGAWRAQSGAELAWTTLDIDPLGDRLLRELSLPETGFGVSFLLNGRASPQVAGLLEPLGPWQEREPVLNWADMAPGLVDAMTVGGQLVGVPFRHATNGLFYNEALLEARGITAPPRTLEEFVDQARRVGGRGADGTPVAGLVMTAALAAFPIMFARAYGGDFITADYKLLPEPQAMQRALALLRSLFEAGVLPRSYALISNDDQVTWMQQGRAAFAILPFARSAQLNREDQSRFPGRIKAVEFPASTDIPAGAKMAAVVEFWSMAVPRNARDKALGWSFIRAMSDPAVTLGAARNGNGPVRVSTYADPAFAAAQPVAAVEARALAAARIPYPAFAEGNRAAGIMVEEVQAAVLGRKPVEQAVADIASRVRPLLPA